MPLPQPPKAVIFDCDGVLVDSEGPTFALLLTNLAQHGLPLTLHALETDYIGGTIETVATRARAAGANLPTTWVADFYTEMYAMLANGTPLMAGVPGLLDRLDAAKIPFAVASNGSSQKMQITLGQHGLLPRFRAALSGPEIGAPKPAPDVFLAAAKACGAAPAECVVIEDSPTGARAALAAHIPCLGYAPHGPDTATAKALTDLNIPLFHSMDDLPRLLTL
ncbi:HAD family phosphatase [Xinfangfangia sp. CPCC 101601]|uniref:HAD family phosphatase n=1 Tax=Pseudogemmobacter lacusdianii TaxID=3069608 RepID=A0ABU0VYP7_9RHOB|nr:HAD family phosphatase [Xinfangfangia sp. CPCC 101601]MDQ2066875.1 HAD family phosphatase [Xinfangfangia sp. CPCC 101601]